VYYAQVIGWRFRLWVSLKRDVQLWKTLISEAIPLGGGLLLRQLGWQLDSLLLYWLADSYSAGLFAGPYRLLLAVRLLSMILVLPLYPGLVRSAQNADAHFWVDYDRALKWLVCLSVPGAVIFVFTPDLVVRLLLGAKFLAATVALQWFGLAFVPMFVSALFPYVYTALARQRAFLFITGIALVVRLSLELWLIPKFGYMSACIIASGCEMAPFAAFVALLGATRLGRTWLDAFVKPGFAGLVMGGALLLTRHYLGENQTLIFTVLLFGFAVLIYLGVLFSVRVFSKAELALAREALNFVGPYLRSLRQKPGTFS
jgi:O-antigen/teichoic acid export membrane protein